MHEHQLLLAFGLTLFAGLSTGIGSALAFFARRTNTRFLSLSLGFSAGVMLYVSLIEIFPKARAALVQPFGEKQAYLYTTLAFFGGVILIALIDQLVPSIENPHEMRMLEELTPTEEEVVKKSAQESDLLRMGMFS
ncbi:MAG TPA: ZIP family metal transporter, partial [Candidatus Ozemobacteraceae bacterium]|nr:ZIP family metal transporter [Candidatus Ozemobacteraceae bacterium]